MGFALLVVVPIIIFVCMVFICKWFILPEGFKLPKAKKFNFPNIVRTADGWEVGPDVVDSSDEESDDLESYSGNSRKHSRDHRDSRKSTWGLEMKTEDAPIYDRDTHHILSGKLYD